MSKDTSNLTIWDSIEAPPQGRGVVYCWNGHAEIGASHSILRYAETHGERLRAKYLAWIHDLGEHRIDGRRLIDHLALGNGLSYWWMTLFVEKSLYKTPISDAIRLLALDEVLVQQQIRSMKLVSGNKQLHRSVSDLCARLGIDYAWEVRNDTVRPYSLVSVYRVLPQPCQALIFLARYLWDRWSLRRVGSPPWFGGDKSLFFCSYFFNISSDQADIGHFHSRYWEDLPRLARKLGFSANWLQHYIPHDALADTGSANKWIDGFNRRRGEEGAHALLDANLSWRVVLKVVKHWLALVQVSRRLKGVERAFRPPDSSLSLWPLLRRDWEASMRGAVAVHNLMLIELFDIAMRDMPYQPLGLYLCENQAWERALVHSWRKHGHGLLIAVMHSTTRFWDLRNFTDCRTIQSPDSNPLPRPDTTALNGTAAIDAYSHMRCPEDHFVACEALRYGYLANVVRKKQSSAEATGQLRVLILGDYVPSVTARMMHLLQAAAARMPSGTAYTVKPHPNCPVRVQDYPALGFRTVTEPLGSVLQGFDVAYASNLTSAAVDAYLAGLPVVVMLDDTELNFSPLRGLPGASFASTSEEVAEALLSARRDATTNCGPNGFFFLDAELPRWRALLHGKYE